MLQIKMDSLKHLKRQNVRVKLNIYVVSTPHHMYVKCNSSFQSNNSSPRSPLNGTPSFYNETTVATPDSWYVACSTDYIILILQF